MSFDPYSKLSPTSRVSVTQLDQCLPQTQCTQCGYPRCRDYAQAVAQGEADINQCPPGGETTIHALARLLGKTPKPLDPHYGIHSPRVRAVIDEAICIGCRKCIDVCPVDAILGARKLMHTVIRDECTGCGLCLPPCPVDCIGLVPVNTADSSQGPWPDYAQKETQHWRERTEARVLRLQNKQSKPQRLTPKKLTAAETDAIESLRKKNEIRAAVQRVREKRQRGSA